MDLTIPILNGIEGARLLNASAVTQHLNVIAYTAKPEAIEGPRAPDVADHQTNQPTRERSTRSGTANLAEAEAALNVSQLRVLPE